MLAFIMLNISVPSSIGRAADITRVRFLAGVCADVAHQCALLSELFIAELTIERPFVRVHSFVYFQFVPLVARVATATAHKPFRSVST